MIFGLHPTGKASLLNPKNQFFIDKITII